VSSQPTQPDGVFGAWPAQARLRALAVFAALLLAGGCAGWLCAGAFAQLFRALCTLALSPLTFGEGGHVQFVAALPSQSLERATSWDVSMVLGIDGVKATHAIALNPRRLLYLPLLTLFACVLAAPLSLSWRARRRALLAGTTILTLIALLSVYLIAVFLFAKVPGLVYTLAPWQSSALRVAYEGWVTPLSNKFVLPLLLAAALLAWFGSRAESRASTQRRADASADSCREARAPLAQRKQGRGRETQRQQSEPTRVARRRQGRRGRHG
jgi:hypothetical protein